MEPIDHTNLHRTAKYFMDNGRASTHGEALALLERFGLNICVGEEIAHSAHHQIALLTLINVARRTFLGGIAVIGMSDCASLTPLAPNPRLIEAVEALGGVLVASARLDWPSALIGNAEAPEGLPAVWQVTWEGWRGGVVPAAREQRLHEREAISLAPALAAAVCAAEAFAFHSGDHPMAGKRAAGLSLWHIGADWLVADADEPPLAYLPSRLWVVGLGNLGQAFAWLLASLPYRDRGEVQFVLQDFDRIAASNDSTSLLSFLRDIGKRKARVVADWLDAMGFETFIEERRFGPWTKRSDQEPGVALCGVDNAQSRAALEDADFELIVEAGLGGGPQAFRSVALHTFPASRTAGDIWARQAAGAPDNFEDMPAYQALRDAGMDKCGLAQLASRTVGIPFVGLIAACLVIAELLRRLNGGMALEFASGSAASLEDFEFGRLETPVYSHGHVAAIGVEQPDGLSGS
ncbi:MAG TPA: thiamine biosynthesis protein ThiF [Candidatus Binatia bacterium]|nr:thiamine biosynthesis protein ThiF [Candidatus Binatia bacterium]